MRIFSINNNMIDFLDRQSNLWKQIGITSDPDLGLIYYQVLSANRLKVVTLLLHLVGREEIVSINIQGVIPASHSVKHLPAESRFKPVQSVHGMGRIRFRGNTKQVIL